MRNPGTSGERSPDSIEAGAAVTIPPPSPENPGESAARVPELAAHPYRPEAVGASSAGPT